MRKRNQTIHRCKFANWIMKMINERYYGKLCWSVNNKDEYLKFANRNNANLWGMTHYKKWAEQYKKTMHTSKSVLKGSLCDEPIECYCGYAYRQINELLRFGKDDEYCTYRELADILAIVLSTAPRIPQNVVLYRMVCQNFINTLIEKNRQMIPTPIQEKGFMSTSLIKTIANEKGPYAHEDNMLKIYVPKDTIGVYVNTVANRSEEEMLLFPDMYLALVSYPYQDNEIGKRVFECQLINFN